MRRGFKPRPAQWFTLTKITTQLGSIIMLEETNQERPYFGADITSCRLSSDVILLETNIRGQIIKEVLRLKEKRVRDALIKLGWTPPWTSKHERMPESGEFIYVCGNDLGQYIGGPPIDICLWVDERLYNEGGTEECCCEWTHWKPVLRDIPEEIQDRWMDFKANDTPTKQ